MIQFLKDLRSHSSIEEIDFEENEEGANYEGDDDLHYDSDDEDVQNVIVPSIRKLLFSKKLLPFLLSLVF